MKLTHEEIRERATPRAIEAMQGYLREGTTGAEYYAYASPADDRIMFLPCGEGQAYAKPPTNSPEELEIPGFTLANSEPVPVLDW